MAAASAWSTSSRFSTRHTKTARRLNSRMPEITDRAAIRGLLERDRAWSVYALGDLEPGYFEHCSWFHTGSSALALLYRAFTTAVLFTMGEPEEMTRLLDEIGNQPALYLQVRPEVVPLVAARYRLR